MVPKTRDPTSASILKSHFHFTISGARASARGWARRQGGHDTGQLIRVTLPAPAHSGGPSRRRSCITTTCRMCCSYASLRPFQLRLRLRAPRTAYAAAVAVEQTACRTPGRATAEVRARRRNAQGGEQTHPSIVRRPSSSPTCTTVIDKAAGEAHASRGPRPAPLPQEREAVISAPEVCCPPVSKPASIWAPQHARRCVSFAGRPYSAALRSCAPIQL